MNNKVDWALSVIYVIAWVTLVYYFAGGAR
jgi:hypothetical protein